MQWLRTATPHRRAMCRSPPRTACESGAAGTATRWASRPQDRQEVKCLVQLLLAHPEVLDRDGGCEPVVEALGDADLRMHRIPARLDREFVHAQLASVEEPIHLDVAEDRGA